MEYKAAPDIDTAKIPENEMMIGSILHCSDKVYVPYPTVVYISPAK